MGNRSITSALGGDEWSASWPGFCNIPRKKSQVLVMVDLRAGHNTMDMRKISAPAGNQTQIF